VVGLIREHVPPLEEDRSLADEIEVVARLIGDGAIAAVADS
jgi:histidine ammonia-lyase